MSTITKRDLQDLRRLNGGKPVTITRRAPGAWEPYCGRPAPSELDRVSRVVGEFAIFVTVDRMTLAFPAGTDQGVIDAHVAKVLKVKARKPSRPKLGPMSSVKRPTPAMLEAMRRGDLVVQDAQVGIVEHCEALVKAAERRVPADVAAFRARVAAHGVERFRASALSVLAALPTHRVTTFETALSVLTAREELARRWDVAAAAPVLGIAWAA